MRLELKDYAKDIKLNLSSVMKPDPESSLTDRQIAGIALASAYSTKSEELVKEVSNFVVDILSEAEVEAAKASASVMAMNNIYYRFAHLSSDKEYLSMPAKLRMNIIGSPGIEKLDFELYALAVSAINGCGLCIDSHVKVVVEAGVDKNTVQHSIRIASVINAAAQALFIN